MDDGHAQPGGDNPGGERGGRGETRSTGELMNNGQEKKTTEALDPSRPEVPGATTEPSSNDPATSNDSSGVVNDRKNAENDGGLASGVLSTGETAQQEATGQGTRGSGALADPRASDDGEVGESKYAADLSSDEEEKMEDGEYEEKVTGRRTVSQTPQALFDQLMTETHRNTDEWEQSASEIFHHVYSSMTFGSKRHKADEGHPAINGEEARALVWLLQAFETTKLNGFNDWIVLMKEIGRVMHQSIWRMTQIISSITGQMRLGPSQAGGPWGGKTEDKSAFLCGPRVYAATEQRELVDYCTRKFQMALEPRQPSELEWKIMVGITEGTIITRHLPQFLRRVSDRENLLKFQLAIEAQVEGHLVGALNDNTPVYDGHQSNKRIVKAITLAARQRREPTERLFAMLKDIKKAGYHASSHSLHFYFFTREAAKLWAGMDIPFKRQKGTLGDVNSAEPMNTTNNVWQRQLGTDGVKDSTVKFRYRVQLLNMNRFLDTATLFACPKKKIGAEFFAYSLDRFGPNSEYSQHWELLFEPTIGSPRFDASAGAVFVADLDGKNCIKFSEDKILTAKKPTATFTSVEDMKATFREKKREVPVDAVVATEDQLDEAAPAPAREAPWNTQRKKNNQKPQKPRAKPVMQAKKTYHGSSRANSIIFSDSESDSDEESHEEAAAKGPAKKKIDCERERQLEVERGRNLDMTTDDLLSDNDNPAMTELPQAIGAHPGETPRSGNCQFHALAEASLQISFQATQRKQDLIKFIESIKAGIKAAANLHFEYEFEDSTRRSLLTTAKRDSVVMSASDTAREVKAYFNDIAASTSEPEQSVPWQVWGGAKILAMASKVLQQKIFLITERPGSVSKHYTVYRPVLKDYMNVKIHTCAEVFMDAKTRLAELCTDNAVNEAASRAEARATSGAGIRGVEGQTANGNRTSSLRRDLTGQFEIESDVSSEISMNDEQDSTQELEILTQKDFYEDKPWANDDWSGDTEDLIEGLDNPAISHDEKKRLQEFILHGRARGPELVIFLTAATDRLTVQERTAIRDLQVDDPEELQHFRDLHRISRGELLQWYVHLQLEQDLTLASSGESAPQPSEWIPSQEDKEPQGEHSRLETPMEKTTIGNVVVNKFNDAVPFKKDKSTRRLSKDGATVQERRLQQTQFEEAWETHRDEWQAGSKVHFPTFRGEQEVWSKAALAEPNRLVYYLQLSTGPHHVLNPGRTGADRSYPGISRGVDPAIPGCDQSLKPGSEGASLDQGMVEQSERCSIAEITSRAS